MKNAIMGYLTPEDLYTSARTAIKLDVVQEDDDTSAAQLVFDAAPHHPQSVSQDSVPRKPHTLNLNGSDEGDVKSMNHILVSKSIPGIVRLPLDSTVLYAIKCDPFPFSAL